MPTPGTGSTHSIAQIFDQAQSLQDNHRKNFVALYKIQVNLARKIEELQNGRLIKLTGERIFQRSIQCFLSRVLTIKKGNPSADCISKFVGGYIKFINEKEERSKDDIDDDGGGSMASRFTLNLLKFLLRGFLAKDKNARYRVLQLVAEMVSHLGEIEEEDYTTLLLALTERLTDKDSNVRHQAVVSLARLCTFDIDSDSASIMNLLLDTLAYDPSSDVRRIALISMPVTDQTLCLILNRTRDKDSNIRKAVYSEVLSKNVSFKEGDHSLIGPTHPRTLNLTQRELVIQIGLRDRDSGVQAAAASLMSTWLNVVNLPVKSSHGMDKQKLNTQESILVFLSLFDLAEPAIAMDALLSIFKSKPVIYNNIEFEGQYWVSLTPEKAFLARVYVEHCKNVSDETKLEANLPVVTEIAFRIQERYNMLLDNLVIAEDIESSGGRDKIDDERNALELTISELLKLALNLDYSDECGRRRTFQLVRDMLSAESLSSMLIAPCLDLLRNLSTSEGDFIRLVIEAIQELRDTAFGSDRVNGIEAGIATCQPELGKKNQEKSSEERSQVDQVDLRCLHLCNGMLERVDTTFEENVVLDGVFKRLIIPSLQRKEQDFKETSLKSLGLFSLIAKPLAPKSINLIKSHITSSFGTFKTFLLQSLFDILLVHKDIDVNVTDFLISHVLKEQDPKVQATICKGICKLILFNKITPADALKNLMKIFLSPFTIDNQELRQCLSFFFQMYSYSSAENQSVMSQIFIHVFLDVCEDKKSLQDSKRNLVLVGTNQVAVMFAEWTDPRHLTSLNSRKEFTGKGPDDCVQLDIARDILQLFFQQNIDIEKEDKRVLCQLLNKLYMPAIVDDFRIRSLKLLLNNLRQRRPLRDLVCNNALDKFETYVTKTFGEQLRDFSEEDFRKFQELNELFQFLDSIIPMNDECSVASKSKRRSRSVSSSYSCPPCMTEHQTRAKRQRLLTQNNEDTEDDNRISQAPEVNDKQTFHSKESSSNITFYDSIMDDSIMDMDSEEEEVNHLLSEE